jgi:hypothetical protein
MNVAHIEKIRTVYNILGRKPEGKRPLTKPTYRQEKSIKILKK